MPHSYGDMRVNSSVLISPLLLVAAVGQHWARLAAGAKVDCYPINGASKEKCESLGCLWEPVEAPLATKSSSYNGGAQLPFEGKVEAPRVGEPWCYFPENYQGYRVVNSSVSLSDGHSAAALTIRLSRTRPSALSNDIKNVHIQVNTLRRANNIVQVKFYDADRRRFEPELPKLNLDHSEYSDGASTGRATSDLKVELVPGAGGDGQELVLRRASTGAIVFSTNLGKLIFSDQFIQLNSRLDSQFLHGLGEHFSAFVKVADSYQTYSFYHYDRLALPNGLNSYGGFPFFVNRETSNKSLAHGVYLRNSNAMDIVLQPEPSITFRPIGGLLDFYVFAGPTANDVVHQFQRLVGLPPMPPRWALGFHLCRFNYGTLNNTRQVWARTRAAGIPFDVQWTDVDAMDHRNDFTYDPVSFAGLAEFVDELHSMDMHYVPIIDPGISLEPGYYPYDLGRELDVFTKNATNETLVGRVWNLSGKTVFVDFSHPVSVSYWSTLFAAYHRQVGFDGAWIDMNDVSSFVSGSIDGCPQDEPYERPVYLPGGQALQQHSICLTARHSAGLEYDVHNLYSFYEAMATYRALQVARPGRRPFIISRSSSPGQGHYGGHWSGDLQANWDYLRWSVVQLIEHSMYGFSLVGSDICGFAGNTTPELCARWSTLGAFYTFSRNHNDDTSIEQDPVALGAQVVAANKNALTKRYSLLPYLYTLMWRAHKYGEPPVKSLAMDFYGPKEDDDTLKVEYQFMWGAGLMVAPIVEQGSFTKRSYLPIGRWYESDVLPEPTLRVPKWIDSTGVWYESRNISLDNLVLFYRGGHILPTYPNVKQTVPQTASQPFGLVVALCPMGGARGQIYTDDGDTIEPSLFSLVALEVANSQLTIKPLKRITTGRVPFGQVKVLGVASQVDQVTVQSKSVPFSQQDHVLVFNLDASVDKDTNLTARWSESFGMHKGLRESEKMLAPLKHTRK